MKISVLIILVFAYDRKTAISKHLGMSKNLESSGEFDSVARKTISLEGSRKIDDKDDANTKESFSVYCVLFLSLIPFPPA